MAKNKIDSGWKKKIGSSGWQKPYRDPVFTLKRFDVVEKRYIDPQLAWAYSRGSYKGPCLRLDNSLQRWVKTEQPPSDVDMEPVVVVKMSELRQDVSLQGCFRHFLDLADGSERKILNFITRWGLLHHEEKYERDGSKPRGDYLGASSAEVEGPDGFIISSSATCEPLATYVWMAKGMSSGLLLVSYLVQGQRTRNDDWNNFLELYHRLVKVKVDKKQFLKAHLHSNAAQTEQMILLNIVDEIFLAYRDAMISRLWLAGTTRERRLITQPDPECLPETGGHEMMQSAFINHFGVKKYAFADIPAWEPSCNNLELALILEFIAAVSRPEYIFECAYCHKPFDVAELRQRGDGKRYCQPEDGEIQSQCQTNAKNERNKKSYHKTKPDRASSLTRPAGE